MLVFSHKTIIFIISFFNNLNFLHTLRSENYVNSLIFYATESRNYSYSLEVFKLSIKHFEVMDKGSNLRDLTF